VRLPTLSPALALLPLRLFLGATFVYAGIHKLSDPGFLHEGSPTYIGTQLEGFAEGTPGGVILRNLALPIPEVAGVGVALVEITIGLLAFFGLFTRLAAAAGLSLSVFLFLTATWSTRPYFLGSDITFAFAWVPFVLAGAQGQPALDGLGRRGLAFAWRRTLVGRVRAPAVSLTEGLTRRSLLGQALGLTGVATLGIAGGSLLTRGRYEAKAAGPRAAAGVWIGASGDVPAGGALPYRDPADGTPCIAVRSADGALVAFSAVCTHAACEVTYRADALRCPCHGGAFDAGTGEVVAGPPPRALAAKRVEERDGQIYQLPGAGGANQV
jgi:thiosulfate dehydrogenase (quinone) large subunit